MCLLERLQALRVVGRHPLQHLEVAPRAEGLTLATDDRGRDVLIGIEVLPDRDELGVRARVDGIQARGRIDDDVEDAPSEGFDAQAEVSKDGLSASGDSIMGLLMLAASRGTTIDVETSGPDAEALADALETLVNDKFGEGF